MGTESESALVQCVTVVVTLIEFAWRRHVVRMTYLSGSVPRLSNRQRFVRGLSRGDRGWIVGLA